MKWLLLAYALTFSYVPHMDDIITWPGEGMDYVAYDNAYKIDVALEAKVFGFVRVYGNVDTYAMPDPDFGFRPFRADYRVGAELYAGAFSVGAWHECDHGVLTGPHPPKWYGKDITAIYVRISGKL